MKSSRNMLIWHWLILLWEYLQDKMISEWFLKEKRNLTLDLDGNLKMTMREKGRTKSKLKFFPFPVGMEKKNELKVVI